MTYNEQRRLAVRREIEELQSTVRQFDQVVADAQRLADELRAGVARLESIHADEDRIDAKVDYLDRLMRRGRYADYPCAVPANQTLSEALVDISTTAHRLRVPPPSKL